MTDIDVSCEVILASLQFHDCQLFYIVCHYVPHSHKQKVVGKHEESLSAVFL